MYVNCIHYTVFSLWNISHTSQNYGFLKNYLQLHNFFGHILSRMQWWWWTRLIISTRSLFYQDHSTKYCHPFFWVVSFLFSPKLGYAMGLNSFWFFFLNLSTMYKNSLFFLLIKIWKNCFQKKDALEKTPVLYTVTLLNPSLYYTQN